jgi:hypothetical protein
MIRINTKGNKRIAGSHDALISCGQNAENKNNSKESSPAEKTEHLFPVLRS